MMLRGCFVDLGRCLGKDIFVLLVCNWFLLFDDIDGSILLFFDVNGRFDDGWFDDADVIVLSLLFVFGGGWITLGLLLDFKLRFLFSNERIFFSFSCSNFFCFIKRSSSFEQLSTNIRRWSLYLEVVLLVLLSFCLLYLAVIWFFACFWLFNINWL